MTRFKLDENLPVQAASILKDAGYDVSTVLSQSMGGAEDSAVVKAVIQEGRTLVTLDLDFADIRAYPPCQLPGLVVLRLKGLDVDSILSAMATLVTFLDKESPQGKLWILDGTRLRIRE